MFYKLLKLVLLLVLLSNVSYSKWNKLDTQINENIQSMYFQNQDKGFIATSPVISNNGNLEYKGSIYMTQDAGASWELMFEGDSLYNFREIKFLTNNIGFAVGYIGRNLNENDAEGLVMKTTDGGNSWVKQENEQFKGVVFTTISVYLDTNLVIGGGLGISSGFDGILLKSTNKGTTWEKIDMSFENMNTVYKFEFNSNNSANMLVAFYDFTIGLTYSLFSSDESLYNWQEIKIPKNKMDVISDFNFFSKNRGYVVGSYKDKQAILKTSDGGLTWVDALNDYSNNGYLTKVQMMDFNTIIALGLNVSDTENRNSLYITKDNGNNWTNYIGDLYFSNYVNSLALAYKSQHLFADFLYVGGDKGLLYRIKLSENPTIELDSYIGSFIDFFSEIGGESEVVATFINFENIEDTVSISLDSDDFLISFETEPTKFQKSIKIPKELAYGNRLFYIIYKPNSTGIHQAKLNFRYFGAKLLQIDLKGESIVNGIEEPNGEILVYPNPASNNLNINNNGEKWRIISSQGIVIREGNESQISTDSLINGSYYLIIYTTPYPTFTQFKISK